MSKEEYNSKDRASGEIAIIPEEELKKIVPQITQEEAKNLKKLILKKIEVSQVHSGPLPHPKILADYDKVKKGFAERIMQMAENEQSHRHICTKEFMKNDNLYTLLGIFSGFIIAMTAISGGIYLALQGRSAAGLSTIIGSLVALVAVFITAKKKNEDDQ